MSHEVVNAASDAGIISVEQASRELKSVMGPEDFDLFWENAKTWDACFQENGESYLDVFKYSSIYCVFDVLVLRLCWGRYRKTMMTLTDVDPNTTLTITSLAFRYLLEQKSFMGMAMVPLSQRAFIERCIVGGRVTTRVSEHTNKPEQIIVNAARDETLKRARPGQVVEGTLSSLCDTSQLIDDIDMNSW